MKISRRLLDRIHDVDGAPAILLSHDRRLATSIRLLPHGREDFEAMVDPPKLIGNLDEAQLGKSAKRVAKAHLPRLVGSGRFLYAY